MSERFMASVIDKIYIPLLKAPAFLIKAGAFSIPKTGVCKHFFKSLNYLNQLH